jgi:hypothetical protein
VFELCIQVTKAEAYATYNNAGVCSGCSDWMQSDQPASKYAGTLKSLAANDEIASSTHLLAGAGAVLP